MNLIISTVELTGLRVLSHTSSSVRLYISMPVWRLVEASLMCVSVCELCAVTHSLQNLKIESRYLGVLSSLSSPLLPCGFTAL